MIENAEVPMRTLPDGRKFITDETVRLEPFVKAFVDRFSNYWQRDDNRCGWVSPKD